MAMIRSQDDYEPMMARQALRTPPALWTGLRRGLHRACPACGLGPLFQGYIAVLPVCPVCDNVNDQYPSDDFAPYVTIFLILHLLIPVLIVLDHAWDMPVILETLAALPLFLVITLLVLPVAKGMVIGFSWAMGVTRTTTSTSVDAGSP